MNYNDLLTSHLCMSSDSRRNNGKVYRMPRAVSVEMVLTLRVDLRSNFEGLTLQACVSSWMARQTAAVTQPTTTG